jgi:hypothetical protein
MPSTLRAPSRPKTKYLGTFSKGVEGSVAMNFSASGGKFCDRRCPHHPDSTAPNPSRCCYAKRCERRPDRTQLLAKLRRHEKARPDHLARLATNELRKLINRRGPLPWLRLCTNGSLPSESQASPSFTRALRNLLAVCNEHNIPVHLPVETTEKTEFYRKTLGDLAVVRQSAASQQEFLQSTQPCSFTAGRPDQTRLERVQTCLELARRKRAAAGRITIVCPAIQARYISKDNQAHPKAKCGHCTACAKAHFDIIYPLH